jgi:hypothetical protein
MGNPRPPDSCPQVTGSVIVCSKFSLVTASGLAWDAPTDGDVVDIRFMFSLWCSTVNSGTSCLKIQKKKVFS